MAAKKLTKIEMAQSIYNFMVEKPGFHAAKKLLVTEASEKGLQAEFTVTEELSNPGGGLHGGAAATIADVVSTLGLMVAGSHPGVSVNLSMNYVRFAKIGEKLIVDTRNLKIGKTLAYLDISLRRKTDNELIASGTHVKHVGSAQSETKITE